MASGVITVGRYRYAVGLYWENSPGGGRVAQIAKEAARQPGQQADFYAVRPGTKDGRVPQFGLCSNEAGQDAGMPVLAACLASQIPGSWAGAFRLNEGIALVVIRDELIVPDGDLFFKDEAEARDRLIQEVGFGGLQSIYAPESWSIPGADAIPLALLLNDQKDIQLQRVTMSRKTKLLMAGGAASLALVLGIVWYFQEQAAEEARLIAQQQQEALLRAQQTSLANPFRQQEAPPPKYERVWESAPKAMDVIKGCYEGLPKIPSATYGWRITSVRCTGSSLSIMWARDKGATLPPPGAAVLDNAGSASLAVPLTPLTPRGEESLLDIAEVTSRYLSQNWPGSIARAPDDPLPPPPPNYSGPWNPPPPPWVKRSFTLSVSELPAGLPDYLGTIPGLIINTMNFVPGGSFGQWSVDGVIYENRK